MIEIAKRIVILKGSEYEKYKRSKEREFELIGQRQDLEKKVAEVGIELARVLVKEKYIDVDVGDPAPTKSIQRKEYVAEVAGLHKKILEPKLKQMISVSHNLLESVAGERDFDLIMKGVVYSFREILKWGEAMVSEHMANESGENPSSPEDKKSKE